MLRIILAAALVAGSFISAQTVTLTGTVLSVSGQPIAGATCQLKGATNKAVTDAQGKYDFARTVGIRRVAGYSVSLSAQGRSIDIKLDHPERVQMDLYSLSGRFVRNVASEEMGVGEHRVAFTPPSGARQLYLLRVNAGSESAWHKLTVQDGIATLTASSAAPVLAASALAPAAKVASAQAVADSLYCTEPNHSGGLANINGRSITSYSGVQSFRMFSLDPAWQSQCAVPMTFNFDNSSGAAHYKALVPDYVKTEQEVLVEVCQSVFKLPDQPKKYASYVANIKSGAGGQVAATGGNTLGFSTEYIDQQPNNWNGWYEIVGVQTHEATHSYQPYYNTTGADGFGEAMPDAVRALNGFFKWPKGTRCSGSFTDVYQTGGKYWYFIELKHPGFLTSVWQQPNGDISTRVQSITGESLSSMATECQNSGMPY